MASPYRPYVITVYKLGPMGVPDEEGKYMWPERTLAQAKKKFLKKYEQFDNENYQIEGAMLKFKGWKIFMEKVGEKSATDSSG